MRTIRHSVFETNSSSSHSISISKETAVMQTLPVGADGVLRFSGGEFGWEFEHYSSAMSKAIYALTWAKQYGTKEDVAMLRKVLKEQTGAKKVLFESVSDEYYPWGYIDHQSDDVCKEAFVDEETLRMFIFNPQSNFTTDNDNH
jgi:hypothetical protein